MTEYELFVDTETSGGTMGRGSIGGSHEIEHLKLGELEQRAETHEEFITELRDPSSLETFKARVQLASNPDALPGADELWLIRTSGRFIEAPWAVRIIERIEEEEEEVKALPRRRLSLAERKGTILSDLLKQREDKMKGKK
jgi:hypothetical protein